MADHNSINASSPSSLGNILAALSGASFTANRVPIFFDNIGTLMNSTNLLSTIIQSTSLRLITSSGTYTPTSGMLYVLAFAVGGGGAGGGTTTASATTCGAAGGGGGGAISISLFSAATIGASQSVTIGAGGIGVAAGNGGSGGNTSLGALLSANGGSGAVFSNTIAVDNQSAGGVGGAVGASGVINFPGSPGFSGLCITANSATQTGSGGSGLFGGGGAGDQIVANTSSPGNTSISVGGGGAGAGIIDVTGVNQPGGNGTTGCLLLLEFIK